MVRVVSQFYFSAFEGTTLASGVAFGALAGDIVVRPLNDAPCEGARHDTRGGCGTPLGNENIEIFSTTPYLRAIRVRHGILTSDHWIPGTFIMEVVATLP